MRTQSICLALAIVLLCPFASGQVVPTKGFNDRQVPHHPSKGMNVGQETPRDLPGFLTQDRLQANCMSRLDSLRTLGMQLPTTGGKVFLDGVQRSPRPLRRMSSPQSEVFVIDTAIVRCYRYADTTRHLYSFNANTKRTFGLTQKLTGGLWVDVGRETNTYDASSNLLSDLHESWSNGQWVNSTRERWTYDPGNNMLLDLYESWWNGQWSEYYASTYTYDQGGNRIAELFEGYVGCCWENSRSSYTYDARNNMLSWLGEQWSNGEWVNSQRNTYTYDARDNTLSQLVEKWSTGQWGIVARETYGYDASDKMLSHLHEQWWNGQWQGLERHTYTYDASNNMLSWLVETRSNGQWENLGCHTYTYDASNNMLSDLYEYWSSGQWVNVHWQTFAYDGHRNLISFWNYNWSNGSWSPADLPMQGLGAGPIPFVITDSAANVYDFGNCYSVTLVRKSIVTEVASQDANVPATYSLSQNYPNPFNPSTTIKFELPKTSFVRLSVFDILGREVSILVNDRRSAGVYEVKFEGSNLASSVYFYRLQTGDHVVSKKMLVLK